MKAICNKKRRKILLVLLFVSLMAVPIYIHVKGHGHSDVLYHYIFRDFNINKFRCAVFLLDNMRYHASVYGEEALTDEQQAIKDRTDSIYASLADIYGWDSIPVDTIIYKVRRKSIEWAEENIMVQSVLLLDNAKLRNNSAHAAKKAKNKVCILFLPELCLCFAEHPWNVFSGDKAIFQPLLMSSLFEKTGRFTGNSLLE